MGLEKLRARWEYKKAMWRFRNRKVTKSKVLYWYLIFTGVSGFLYAISCLITGFPYWFAFTPVLALIGYFILFMVRKNAKVIWMYVRDMDQGKLLMHLDKNTHYEEKHKIKVLDWIYLPRKTIRNERWLELSEKVRIGTELTKKEKVEIKCNVAYCPQQLLDGVNKAILVNALIWAHQNIQVLDDNLRDILELTDENMMKFDLNVEIDRCRTEESKDKIKKYKEKGMEIVKRKKK